MFFVFLRIVRRFDLIEDLLFPTPPEEMDRQPLIWNLFIGDSDGPREYAWRVHTHRWDRWEDGQPDISGIGDMRVLNLTTL